MQIKIGSCIKKTQKNKKPLATEQLSLSQNALHPFLLTTFPGQKPNQLHSYFMCMYVTVSWKKGIHRTTTSYQALSSRLQSQSMQQQVHAAGAQNHLCFWTKVTVPLSTRHETSTRGSILQIPKSAYSYKKEKIEKCVCKYPKHFFWLIKSWV